MPSRREKIEAMLRENPRDSFLQYALAMELVTGGDSEAARARFRALLEHDPGYVAAYFQLGQLLAGEMEHGEARQILARGIEQARLRGDEHAAGEMQGLLEQLASEGA